MAFGFSFGKKKDKFNQTTSVDRNEDTNQTQTQTQQTNSNTTTQSQTNSDTQSQSQNQSQSAVESSVEGSERSRSTTTQFSSDVLAGLEDVLGTLLGTAGEEFGSKFDRAKYLAGIEEGARSQIDSDLEASLNQMFSAFGGRDDQNSMTALLANKTRNQAGANLASILSQAEAQAAGIEREDFALTSQNRNTALATILQQLRGGVSTTEGAVDTTQQAAEQASQVGAETGSQSTQQATVEQTQAQIIEALLATLVGNTRTTGVESTQGVNKGSGGGFGISI